jgi:hypothetical protein
MFAAGCLQKFRQLGDVGGNSPRLVRRHLPSAHPRILGITAEGYPPFDGLSALDCIFDHRHQHRGG